MISKPCASSSSLMHNGGFVWIELLAIIVYSPWSRKYLPMAFISSDVPLNGVSGVHGSRLRTRSRMPNSPRLRMRPDRRVLRGQPLVVLAHARAQARRVLDEPVLLVDADRRQRGGQRDRMRRVGQPAVEHLLVERLGDVVAHRDRRRAAGTTTSGPWPSSSGRARRPSGRPRTSGRSGRSRP